MFEKKRRRVQRSRGALSILFIDIDMFKAFNDTYGHTAGDDCLRRVAQALLQNLRRAGDLVARYGGEEFAVILPETSLLDAIVVAENLLRAMRELNIEHEKSAKGYVSISIGVAGEVLNFSVDGTNLLQEADAALYRAKDAGRDRVCTSTSSRLQPRLAN
jgi:diguanylate cyclase (GGDEF)-like protein